MIVSGGEVGVLWSNWVVGSMTSLAIVLLFWPLIDRLFSSAGQLLRPAKA
jgi:TctA family transporter